MWWRISYAVFFLLYISLSPIRYWTQKHIPEDSTEISKEHSVIERDDEEIDEVNDRPAVPIGDHGFFQVIRGWSPSSGDEVLAAGALRKSVKVGDECLSLSKQKVLFIRSTWRLIQHQRMTRHATDTYHFKGKEEPDCDDCRTHCLIHKHHPQRLLQVAHRRQKRHCCQVIEPQVDDRCDIYTSNRRKH